MTTRNVLVERRKICFERIERVLCSQCVLITTFILLLLCIPALYIPLKERDGSDWLLAALVFITVAFGPLICYKLARKFSKDSPRGDSMCTCTYFLNGINHTGNCLLEICCCPCMWATTLIKAWIDKHQGSHQTAENRDSHNGNPWSISHTSGQQPAIPNSVNLCSQSSVNSSSRFISAGPAESKQYHLGALIQLACQADRKTAQKHVDSLSLDSQGAEVHNLYHLYALLSLAHQANNVKATQHYKEWSGLVSQGASASRRSSDFYGLPTYEQAVALSHETSRIVEVDLNVMAENQGIFASTDNEISDGIPVNVTIPTYEELIETQDNNYDTTTITDGNLDNNISAAGIE